MGKTRAAYPPEFRRQMVDLVRAGRSPEELAREFEPLPAVARKQPGLTGRHPSLLARDAPPFAQQLKNLLHSSLTTIRKTPEQHSVVPARCRIPGI
jgi:transposase-like protein